jgi:tetratricopeptide (TPR) repeat protein
MTSYNPHARFIPAFEQECQALYISNGDAFLVAKDYDKSIELYSAAIELNPTHDTIFARRCTARLGKMLWEDAVLDAQKVQ